VNEGDPGTPEGLKDGAELSPVLSMVVSVTQHLSVYSVVLYLDVCTPQLSTSIINEQS